MIRLTPFLLALLLILAPALLHAQSNPIRFTPNRGQIIDMEGKLRPDILYTAESPGMRIYFRETGISYVFAKVEEDISGDRNHSPLTSIAHDERSNGELSLYRMDVEFEGASSQPRVTTQETVGDYTNYYLAHCPDGITRVPAYGTITYHDIYPNIDLVFRSTERGMKYDFLVHPGGRVSDIRLRYQGAEQLSMTDDGGMRVGTPLGDLIEGRPETFQENDATPVPSRFRLDGDLLRFDVGVYDSTRTLRIDPELVWSTYLGGMSAEYNMSTYFWVHASSLASDAQRDLVTTGTTLSIDFPVTTGAFQTTYAELYDACVVKLNNSGGRIWATFYGGNQTDQGSGVALDSSNNIFALGYTASADFPVTADAHQRSYGGGIDGYLVKFDGAGARLWATYYGGTYTEWAHGIATDRQGNVLITIESYSTGLATPGAYRTTPGSGTIILDIVVAKFDGAGKRLWATYCGGALNPAGPRTNAVCIDPAGNIYIAAQTQDPMFPTTAGAFQRTLAGGFGQDAIVMKFTPAGGLLWSTFLGGRGNDHGASITLDRAGNVYVSGFTASSSFPVTAGAFQTSNAGGAYDAFLASFTSSGAQRWATYYGGAGLDAFSGLISDEQSNISVTGQTLSTDFPVTRDAYQSTRLGANDAVIVRFDSTGRRLWGTYFGGSNQECGASLAVDGAGLVITGTTLSTDFPTLDAFQARSGGSSDIFISRFCLLTPRVFSPDLEICQGENTQLTAPDGLQYLWSTGATNQSISVNTAGSYWVRVSDGTCFGVDTVMVTVRPLPSPVISTSSPLRFCQGDSVMLDGGDYRSWRWSNGDTTRRVSIKASGSYTVLVTDEWGCSARSVAVVVTVDPLPVARINAPSRMICPDEAIRLTSAVAYPGYAWSTGERTRQIRVTQPGTYWLRITDANGCSSPPDSVVVEMHERPAPVITREAERYCPGDSVTISAPEGYSSYLWSNGAMTRQIRVGNAASYTVTVTDANGCKGTSPAVSAEPWPAVVVAISPAGPLSLCPGASIEITAVDGLDSYRWSTGETTRTIIVGTPGTYSVVGTDANGCRDSASFTLDSHPVAAPLVSGPNPVCENSSHSYSVVPIAGSAYIWSVSAGGTITNGQGTPAITVQWGASGIEQVDMEQRSSEGCSADATAYTVEVGTSLRPAVTPSGEVWRCEGESIELSAAEGYDSYQWSNGERTRTIVVTTGGDYRVMVSDGAGCSGESDLVRVRMRASPAPAIFPSGPILICQGDTATLDAGVWQSYIWSSGARTRTIAVTAAGDYSVTVEDANGCHGASMPVVVTIAPPPTLPTISQRGDTLRASLALSYQWIADGADIAGATDRELVMLQPGSYRVRINDPNGCRATSAPFTPGSGEVASATVVVREHQAAPGERIMIPVDLQRPRFLEGNGLRSFRLKLRFNRSMLMSAGTAVTGTLDETQRTITITGTIDPTEGEQSLRLAEIEFLATLGDAIETPLQIVSLLFDEGPIQLDTIHGRFTLTGLCENGGTRLVSTTGELALKPSRPNPTSGLTTIEYETVEHGPTRIYLADMSGGRISLVDTDLDAGRYLATFDASAIPSGVYICILETRTARLTQALVVEH